MFLYYFIQDLRYKWVYDEEYKWDYEEDYILDIDKLTFYKEYDNDPDER